MVVDSDRSRRQVAGISYVCRGSESGAIRCASAPDGVNKRFTIDSTTFGAQDSSDFVCATRTKSSDAAPIASNLPRSRSGSFVAFLLDTPPET